MACQIARTAWPDLTGDLAVALAGAAGVGAEELARLPLARLAGLTNRVFRVDAPTGSYVLRLPGAGTDRFVDRRNEADNHRQAALLGLAPPLVYSDSSGAMITRFVAGAAPLSAASLRLAPVRSRLARSLRELHGSGAKFRSETDLEAELDRYFQLADAAGADKVAKPTEAGVQVAKPAEADPVAMPTVADRIAPWAEAVAMARTSARQLAADSPPKVPCHNDAAPGNALDDGTRIWFVDWEYASANDPAWDLATATLEGELSADDAGHLLTEYHGRAPSSSERQRHELHLVALDALAGLWALVQMDRTDTDFDFEAYARRRMSRALRRGRAVDLRPGATS